MLPVLLDLKFIKIYTFGVFLVLAFFWGSFFLWKNIRLTSYKEEDVFDGLFFTLLGSLFFGRVVFVILNFEKFGFSLLKFILVNGYPGLSFFGALFGGLVALFIYARVKKFDFFVLIDYFMSPLFLALIFGKVGSFLAGTEIGTKTDFFLSVKYVGYDGLRHPTPLYEAFFLVLGFYISYRLLFEVRREKFFKGFVLYFSLWYLSLTYFLFDKLKISHLYLLGRSLNVVIAAILLLTFSLYFIYYFRSSIISILGRNINLVGSYGSKTFTKISKSFGRTTPKGGKKA